MHDTHSGHHPARLARRQRCTGSPCTRRRTTTATTTTALSRPYAARHDVSSGPARLVPTRQCRCGSRQYFCDRFRDCPSVLSRLVDVRSAHVSAFLYLSSTTDSQRRCLTPTCLIHAYTVPTGHGARLATHCGALDSAYVAAYRGFEASRHLLKREPKPANPRCAPRGAHEPGAHARHACGRLGRLAGHVRPPHAPLGRPRASSASTTTWPKRRLAAPRRPRMAEERSAGCAVALSVPVKGRGHTRRLPVPRPEARRDGQVGAKRRPPRGARHRRTVGPMRAPPAALGAPGHRCN